MPGPPGELSEEPAAAPGAEPAAPAPRPWYRRKAVWVPACGAVIGLGLVVAARRRRNPRSMGPSCRRVQAPSMLQIGVVNIYSRPDVHRPSMTVVPRTPRRPSP